MSAAPTRTVLFALLLLPLFGCGNSPQQPSDTIDDKAAESPRLGDGQTPAEPSTDVEALDEALGVPGGDPVVTSSVPAPPVSLDAVVGRWAVDPGSCDTEAGADLVISPTDFESRERVCRVASTTDSGDGSMTATLACPEGAAGEAASELVKLTPDGQNLTLSFVGSGEPEQTFSRCE